MISVYLLMFFIKIYRISYLFFDEFQLNFNEIYICIDEFHQLIGGFN